MVTVDINSAKNVFALHGVDQWRLNKKPIRRSAFARKFFSVCQNSAFFPVDRAKGVDGHLVEAPIRPYLVLRRVRDEW